MRCFPPWSDIWFSFGHSHNVSLLCIFHLFHIYFCLLFEKVWTAKRTKTAQCVALSNVSDTNLQTKQNKQPSKTSNIQQRTVSTSMTAFVTFAWGPNVFWCTQLVCKWYWPCGRTSSMTDYRFVLLISMQPGVNSPLMETPIICQHAKHVQCWVPNTRGSCWIRTWKIRIPGDV